MATRARVALQLKEDKIIGSYQHWDGYPGGLGYNLVDNWYKADKVTKAIKLGDAKRTKNFLFIYKTNSCAFFRNNFNLSFF